MTLLSVNVNKIALLRNSRGTNYPDLLYFVQKIIGRGVQGITVHPRPDERHITRQDARDIAALLKNHPGVEFNIEGYPTDGFMAMIEDLRPAQCTLVPDEPGQLTSDHGWDVTGNRKLLCEVLAQLRSWQVRSSLFLDPVPGLVNDVQSVGADRIELYTEHYARVHAQGSKQRLAETLQQYHGTARVARDAGIGVNAGHDLNLDNLADLLAGGLIQEVSIGHALIVESLEQGMGTVLDRYLAITRHAD